MSFLLKLLKAVLFFPLRLILAPFTLFFKMVQLVIFLAVAIGVIVLVFIYLL